jgi:hypothetical protein
LRGFYTGRVDFSLAGEYFGRLPPAGVRYFGPIGTQNIDPKLSVSFTGKKESSMRYGIKLLLASVLLLGSSMAALGGDVRTDFNHQIDFSQFHTYSWGKVQTSDPFYVTRIQQAVDQQLQAKGWQLMPSGGAVTVFATDNMHNHQETQTMYDGLGGGWGGGWGWGGWGWRGGWGFPGGGIGEATTTTVNQPVASLVIDLFDSNSKQLLWRGLASENLSSNAGKNTKTLDGDIKNMFKNFPPKPGNS